MKSGIQVLTSNLQTSEEIGKARMTNGVYTGLDVRRDGYFRTDRQIVAHERARKAYLDETEVVSKILKGKGSGTRIMVDVGAHHGHSAKHFADDDWKIFCFEPDSKNRIHLVKRFGDYTNVKIDTRAVGREPAIDVPYFRSEESSGISGLSAFRESHEQSSTVEVTTIADVLTENTIGAIDFLKIDVEGFDFDVLRGVPWHILKPGVIECEYEDAKTRPMGHLWTDIADYLVALGYSVYVSEWHPITRYGVPHDWNKVVPYPECDVPTESWGNIVAFLDDPGFEAVQQAFLDTVQFRSEAAKPAVKAVPKPQAKAPAPAQIAPAATSANEVADQDVEALVAGPKRPFYAQFAEGLRSSSPRAFAALQFVFRAARGAARRWFITLPALAIIIGLAVSGFTFSGLPGPAYMMLVAAIVALALAILYLGYTAFIHTRALAAESRELRLKVKELSETYNTALLQTAGQLNTTEAQHDLRIRNLRGDFERLRLKLDTQLSDMDPGATNLRALTNIRGEFSNLAAFTKQNRELASQNRVWSKTSEATLTEMVRRLEAAQSEISEVAAQTERSKRDDAQSAESLANLQASYDEIRQTLSAYDAIDRQIEDLKKQISDLTAELKDTRSKTDQTSAEAETVSASLTENVDAIEQKIAGLNKRQDEALHTAIKSILTKHEALAPRVDTLDKGIDATKTELEQIKKDVEAAQLAAKSVEESFPDIALKAKVANRQAQTLTARVNNSAALLNETRYPNAPQTLVFLGHHKCASRLFRNILFKRISETFDIEPRRYSVSKPPFHYSKLDELDLSNIDFEGLGEGDKRDLVLFANATDKSLAKVKSQTEDWRALRIVRDPRQVLVSAYFHHLKGHPTEGDGWVWDQLIEDRKVMASMSKEDGILHELNNISAQVIGEQVLGTFDDERILTIKFEDFLQAPAQSLTDIAAFLQVPEFIGLDLTNKHRTEESGPWEQHFTSRIRSEFKERYGRALIDMGYAKDMDW